MQKSTAATRPQFSSSDSASNAEASTHKTTPRLIAMALSLVGERSKLIEEMRCSHADFLSYSSGRKELPLPELDRLISIIVREQGIVIAKNRDIWNAIRSKRNPPV